jgi:hypothetical protein
VRRGEREREREARSEKREARRREALSGGGLWRRSTRGRGVDGRGRVRLLKRDGGRRLNVGLVRKLRREGGDAWRAKRWAGVVERGRRRRGRVEGEKGP